MNDLLAYFTLRTFLVFASTAFSLLFVMLVVGIITVDDVIKICGLSPEAASAFRLVVSRVQEVTGNILDIISQLLNKIFSWAGVDIDLNKIHTNVNAHPGDVPAAATDLLPGSTSAGSASSQSK